MERRQTMTLKNIISSCAAAALALTMTSCTGNGGSADSAGSTYIQGGGTSTTPSTSRVENMLAMFNSGNLEGMISLVAGENSSQTEVSTMKASDIGLPAGGMAILTIMGDAPDYSESTVGYGDFHVYPSS
ncbi:MAG: hypothetical protein IJU95_10420 [Treponema sp.]|nr:hypothetical protein [Treponema sp.]